MAACTRWKVLFPVLILCVSLLGMVVSVSGDAALIKDVCSKTSRPFYCETCYEFYSQSSKENVKDLGRTSIRCAFSEFDTFRSSLRSFMINPKNLGPGLQNACNQCLFMLESVDKKIQNAAEKWQKASYASSSLQMLIAVNIINDSCGRELMKFNLPKFLADQQVRLDGFCQASIGVLDQIPE
ncbi:uncharacterized protein LOC121240087 [Juglans microcarpa x Juglans regia]|uniref:uncharacterized protein LOC121240084 n=1 Tax=Juglans microcarpa x Juglans regia TaxID=2249226 RepID=UPI001B7E143B|nr:uncharacterized protein LOC121240084 [Juglans microcarpa x Juglans regia]XP_040993479.1 uncharacterized protein LOC121240084 [Juglans microcarpa x Juglans regia]XP_040993480.1 uncharacterized protein LOC121240084 [Juglans microcarpa x Juglans regia]XP_040993481.1 uncharacterized protein LOC121240086 [Juglans microcarpa x Juglans regia]XP_040993482.1 uncharacterized protein LOC121240086 [Juglans microcarpa x Juglans regia]XP_040993483.1 uncharacterized protein LOC121240086 [Juglans microcarp